MKTGMRNMVSPIVEMVNFEAANKIPAIRELVECKKSFMKDKVNIWYEYIPKSYDASKKVPLIMQIHGGGHDGRRWANLTIWHEMAEKEGFIVVYPNSPEYGCWPCEEEDIQYVYDLIDEIKGKYNIDEERVYMQGMSNGDMMTLAFSMKYPKVLAAAAYMSGPSAEEILDGDRPTGALPIIQMRGEHDIFWRLTPEVEDVYEIRYEMNDLNKEIWDGVNKIEGIIPKISISGKDNLIYYEGENAPTILWEIQGMGHREPVYSAQFVWDRLYSGYRREKEGLICENLNIPMESDKDIVFIAAGSNKAYKNGEIIRFEESDIALTKILIPAEAGHFCPLKLGEMCETEAMAVPLHFFEKVYGAKIEVKDSGSIVNMELADGRKLKLEADSLLINVDGKYIAMQKPCILRCGIFYIPVEEFVRLIFGKRVSFADDVLCITDHYAELGRYTARVVRKMLGGGMRAREKAIWR